MRVPKRALEVADYMRQYLSENDNMPNPERIAAHFGFTCNAAVCHIQTLVKHAVLERSENVHKFRFLRGACNV